MFLEPLSPCLLCDSVHCSNDPNHFLLLEQMDWQSVQIHVDLLPKPNHSFSSFSSTSIIREYTFIVAVIPEETLIVYIAKDASWPPVNAPPTIIFPPTHKPHSKASYGTTEVSYSLSWITQHLLQKQPEFWHVCYHCQKGAYFWLCNPNIPVVPKSNKCLDNHTWLNHLTVRIFPTFSSTQIFIWARLSLIVRLNFFTLRPL